MSSHWTPITDLPAGWQALQSDELHALARMWHDYHADVRDSKVYEAFLQRMCRRIAIETGVLERLYSLDRRTTRLLIEVGIDEALIAHGATNQPVEQVVALIRDHEEAIQRLFDLAREEQPFTVGSIQLLHQLITRSQSVEAFGLDVNGVAEAAHEQQAWPPPVRRFVQTNGTGAPYTPPEHVDAEIDRLLALHLAHDAESVAPEVEAAWLHHRFTQIHPFTEGNERIARLLASLVFVRAGWFPLVLSRDERKPYLHALEAADAGDLKPLVDLFARAQRQELVTSLGLASQVMAEGATVESAINAVVVRIKQGRFSRAQKMRNTVEGYAGQLHRRAFDRFMVVRADLFRAVAPLVNNVEIHVLHALASSENSSYYRSQIVTTAKALDYYANLSEYKSWVRLAIRLANQRTELLLSFHVMGYEHIGVMACSGCAYRKSVNEDENPPTAELEPLSQSPFQFSYADTYDSVAQRFDDWLEDVLIVGIEYWRRGL